jgi:hypothetical protein
VVIGDPAEVAEAGKHDSADSGLADRVRREWFLAESHLDQLAAPAAEQVDRLEISPVRKHPDHLQTMCSKLGEV